MAIQKQKNSRLSKRRSHKTADAQQIPNYKSEKRNYKFIWKGTNSDQEKDHGSILATSMALAKAQLAKKGIQPTSLRQESALLAFMKRTSVKKSEITQFTRQLATMVNAGIPLLQCFEVIIRGSDNMALNDLLLNIKTDIESGIKFSETLAKHPNQFNQLYCALIEAGEEAGALSKMLSRLASYMEKSESVQRKIKKALFYPGAVVAIGLIVSAILLLKVVPQFKSLYAGFGAKLPAFTASVLNLSDWMQKNYITISAVIFLMIASSIVLHRRSISFQRALDWMSLKVPIIGAILTKGILARFARTLATTFSAGMPLISALKIVARAPNNLIYETAINKARAKVTEGKALNTSLEATGLFPNIMVQMIAIGEETGELDEMLNKTAAVYEEEIDTAVDALSSLIEPMIMVVLGVLVGGLVIAMYLPIFQLSSVIQ